MKLPKYLFVTVHKESDGSEWLSASPSQVEAVEASNQDEPIVGNYMLMKANKVRLLKTIAVVPKKKRAQ